MQESFSPLPPPKTPTPSGREYRAASASLIHNTNDPLPQWLQSPSPEVEIQRPEWQPNHRLHLDLAPVVKKVVDSMPAHHLLEPYNGKTFEDPNATFN